VWALKIETFLGPEMATSDASANLAQQVKIVDCTRMIACTHAKCNQMLSIRMSTPEHFEPTLTLFRLKKTFNLFGKMIIFKRTFLYLSDGSKMKQK